MSLLDMLTNAAGVQNPMGAINQAIGGGSVDPYAAAAQFGATPPTLPGGGANPAYSTAQQSMQSAQAQEAARARAMGLIQAGASMMGARDPRTGRPAGFGLAASQGLEGGVKGDEAYRAQEAAQAEALLKAQQGGQGLAAGNQQMQQGAQTLQMGQFGIDDAKVLQQMFGVTNPAIASLKLGMLEAGAQQQTLQQIMSNPAASPQMKLRAQMLLPTLMGGKAIPNLGDQLLGKAESPDEQALKQAQAGYNRAGIGERNAIGGYYAGAGAGGAGGKADTAAWATASKVTNDAFRMSPEITKMFGGAPGPAATSAVHDQLMGMWPTGFPPKDFVMNMAKTGKLHAGDSFSVGPIHYLWTGKFLIPSGGMGALGGEGAGEPGEPATPGEPAPTPEE